VQRATLTEVDALMAEVYAVRVRGAFADTPAGRAHDGINLSPEHGSAVVKVGASVEGGMARSGDEGVC
jgi:hypothetical protein